MLVLSRKIGEELHIGNDTIVFVQAIAGNRVRLGIQAPHATRVLRGELKPFGPVDCLDDIRIPERDAEQPEIAYRPRKLPR